MPDWLQLESWPRVFTIGISSRQTLLLRRTSSSYWTAPTCMQVLPLPSTSKTVSYPSRFAVPSSFMESSSNGDE